MIGNLPKYERDFPENIVNIRQGANDNKQIAPYS